MLRFISIIIFFHAMTISSHERKKKQSQIEVKRIIRRSSVLNKMCFTCGLIHCNIWGGVYFAKSSLTMNEIPAWRAYETFK